jgi:DNA-binding IclR family transcriptional regulator
MALREGTTSLAAENGVEAVDRALSIMSCFRDGSLTLAEIAERTGYYKSTILRICVSLENGGFLARLQDKRFSLGAQLMRLGSLYQRSFKLEDHVRAVLRRLREESGESASFYRREGDHRLCLYREDSIHSVRDHIREGDLLPLDKGAAGHVLLEFDRNHVDGAALRSALDKLPYYSSGERDSETAAIAAPVFGQRGELVGALALSGPITRFTPGKVLSMGRLIMLQSEELNQLLGSPTVTR